MSIICPCGVYSGLQYSISVCPCFFFFYCLFIFSACLSSSLFCCFSVTLFGLFGLKLILSVPAGLGRKTQITITNQTATPTAALTTPISQTFCIYQVCFSRLTSSCPVQSHSLSVPALFTQTNLLSHFSLGPWLISLLSLSVSGLCLFCAHVCPWVPEILMCLCLVIMRTVDGGLKICFSYSDWIAKKKGTLMAPGANKNTGKKESDCRRQTETDGREGRSGREDGVKAVMTFKMNNALSCITQTRRSDWRRQPISLEIQIQAL